MLKNKKILLSFGAVAVTAVPVFAIVSFSVNKNGQFIYDGKRFSSEESLMSYLTDQNIAKMNQVKVFGELASSYAYYEKGLLNKNLLPDYDPSSTHLAYFKAGGSITSDYEDARRSYYNPGRVVPKYEDGWGGSYHSSSAAAQAFKDKIIESAEGYKEVDFINDNSSEKRKINPLNASDVTQLKNNISNNFQKIVMDQFTDDKNLGYKIDLADSSVALEDLKFSDIAKTKTQVINKNINSSWKIDAIHTGSGRYYNDYSGVLTINLGPNKVIRGNYYPWYNIPNGQPVWWTDAGISNQSWYWSVNTAPTTIMGDVDFVERSKTIAYTADNIGPNVMDSLNDLSFSQIKQIISPNQNDSSNNISVSFNKGNEKLHTFDGSATNELNNINDSLNNTSASIKNAIANPYSYISSQAEFFKSNNLENYFSRTHSLKDSDINVGETKFTVDTLPVPKTHRWDSGHGSSADNYVEIPTQTLSWQVSATKSYSLNSSKDDSVFKNDNFSKIAYNLSKNQSSYKNGIPIVIKDKTNEDTLFKANLKLSDDKTKLAIDELIVDNNGFNYSEKINGTESKQEPLFAKFVALYNEANNTNASFVTIKEKLEEIIKSTSIGSFGNIGDSIDNKSNFSIFFKQLKALVDAHDSDSEMVKKSIFENIKKQIPNPKGILFFRNLDNFEDLDTDNKGIHNEKATLRLTKYLISSPSEFNSPLASGRYSETKINSDADLIKLKDSLSKFTPTETLTAYDADGMPLNKDYIYDREDLLEYNSIMSIEPRRDFSHIYIDGHNNPISNEVHSIYHLQYKGVDLYFDTFLHLKTYLLEEILQKEITWI